MSDLKPKVKLLDYGPKLGDLGPDEIVAASGFNTYYGGDILETAKGLSEKDVENFHKEATRRGHASLLTLPEYYLEISGTKAVDLELTASRFGTFLISSTRRIEFDDNLFLYREVLSNEPNSAKEVQRAVKKAFNSYKELRKAKIKKDYARRVLPLGIYTIGLFKMSLQSMLSYSRSFRERERWISPDLKEIGKRFQKIAEVTAHKLTKAYGERLLINDYPEKSVFKAPKYYSWNKDILIVQNASQISESDELSIMALIPFETSLAVWNEVKRHRTMPQSVESIYSAAKRALTSSEGSIYLPPILKRENREKYLEGIYALLSAYERVYREAPGKAALLLPLAIKIRYKVLALPYHLFNPSGFFGIRLCKYADFELREELFKVKHRITLQYPWLGSRLEPKCKTGICPERKPCSYLRKFTP